MVSKLDVHAAAPSSGFTGRKHPFIFLILIVISFSATTFMSCYFNLFSGRELQPSRSFSVIKRSRMAVCLVGEARMFELTRPSIIENVLKVYPNAELFLHSPLDNNSFKFSLLKSAPRIASVRIFRPSYIPETESTLRRVRGGSNGVVVQVVELTEWRNDSMELCDGSEEWEYGWERVFDEVVGEEHARERKRVVGLSLDECLDDFKVMMKKTVVWDVPSVEEICRIGIDRV
ncbi:hypothetical protein LINPERHAP2_LOCUS11062 [Linum perenne]